MVTVITSSKKPSEDFKQHLIKTSGLHKNLEVLIYENNGEYSLTEIYNKGLKEAKNDIIVFCHDDIHINRNNWANKLLKNFTKNPEYSIIGVAGATELTESGCWWSKPHKMYGRVAHRDVATNKVWDNNYSNDTGEVITEVVVVDGVFFAVDRTKIKCAFDETF